MSRLVAAMLGFGLVLVLMAALVACSSDDGPSSFGNETKAGSDASSTPQPPPASFGGDGGEDSAVPPTPVRKIPGLKSITYYEASSGVKSFEFTVDGPEMTTKIDVLDEEHHDIKGVSTEFYDVYYSDIDGNFDIDGPYLTIAGVFLAKAPAGGGLNLAEIALNYEGKPAEYGNYVASYVALGDNTIADSAKLAIDGNLDTCTTMGNTADTPGQLLRVTLGFASSSHDPR